MDLHSTVSFEDTPEDKPATTERPVGGSGYTPSAAKGAKPKRPTGAEARARYGGSIAGPEGISDDVVIEFTLKNDAMFREIKIRGLKNAEDIRARREISIPARSAPGPG